jgi:hypothetical protein
MQEGAWKKAALLCGLIYLAQPILAPFDSENFGRYLTVVLPVFWLWVWRGATSLKISTLRPKTAKAVVIAALAANAVGNLAGNPAERALWDNLFPLDELKEVADWAVTNTPASSRIAVDYHLPVSHFHYWLGRPLVADYFSPRAGESPVTRAAEGFAKADYVLGSDLGFATYPPPPAFHLVKASAHGHFRLYAVTDGAANR